MQLDHAWIESRIPHQGSMCLLDRVLGWDDQSIRCAATSHRDGDNPLRAHGRLAAAAGIEYAAQAMAVHGALCAAAYARVGTAGTGDDSASAPRAGMLASVREVHLRVQRLDDIAADLLVEAKRVSGDRGAIIYEFTLRTAERNLLSGRATVMLDVNATGDST